MDVGEFMTGSCLLREDAVKMKLNVMILFVENMYVESPRLWLWFREIPIISQVTTDAIYCLEYTLFELYAYPEEVHGSPERSGAP